MDVARPRKRFFLLVAVIAIALVASGCAKAAEPKKTTGPEKKAIVPSALRIGTLPTEDILPLWAAESKGLFTAIDLKVTIVPFQSAQERDAAFASGAIDAFMGDIIAAASLEAAEVPVSLATVMLGSTPPEGRFGIVAPPKSTVTSLGQLAGVPVGTSSGTIQEYVLDGLMAQAGVPPYSVRVEEVKKVPVRFELLMAGKLKAAALPDPLLSLAVSQGARLLADDTTGRNLSQTVLVVSDKYLAIPGGMEALKRVLTVWDEGVGLVNAAPESWRAVLVEKARLPKPLETTYEVNLYPKAQPPAKGDVDAVLEWMRSKGLLKTTLSYEDLVQTIPK